jgi:DNA processing protein
MMQVEGISGDLAAKTKGIDLDTGTQTMDKTASMGAKYFTYWDSDYSEHLKTIYDAPVGIFVLGDIPQLPFMGIVGTRQPSPYGKKMVKILTLDLINAGFCIVSGFARGIDTWAHKTVHKYNGSTIAVFGNGLDICYPGENRKLLELLLENGAFIPEFIPGTKPDAVNFPKRNRIISGLSKGVLVIEAGKKSGAIITALNALNQNREVFALPGQTDSAK